MGQQTSYWMLQIYSYMLTYLLLILNYSSDAELRLLISLDSYLLRMTDPWTLLHITKTDCAYCALHIIAYSYFSSLLIIFWLVDKTSPIMYINPRYKLYFFSFILGFSTLC